MKIEEFNALLSKYKKGEVSTEELGKLEPYKVDNAIILAAGFGLRSLPLSRTVPKGLYVVKGEVLIERQIKQLLEVGIKEIIVVVGYLKEEFEYLKEKYGVVIVDNNDYYRYNNISSLYAARDYLKNSFVCCSDNYFNVNIFEPYVFDSYYSCLYAEGYVDEYCVTKTDGDYIKEIIKGGSNAWYTIGEAYFCREFSKKFCEYLEDEYNLPEIRKMLWDDFHIRHIESLPLRLYKYNRDIVQEFDTIEDVEAFDEEFKLFYQQSMEDAKKKHNTLTIPEPLKRYDDVTRYNSATTDVHNGRLHLNENLFGPSPVCLNILNETTMSDLYEYDMESTDFLTKEISRAFSIPEDDIYIHNGSAELIKSLFSIALEEGDTVLVANPGWSYYDSLAKEKFCIVATFDIKRDDYEYYFDGKDLFEKMNAHNPKLVIINSPHNPTGCKIQPVILEKLVKEYSDSLVLLDEAYFGFEEENIDVRRLIEQYSNLIITRTFSKYYALAGIRIGFAMCNFKIKPIFGLDLPLFRESKIARNIAKAALQDKKYYEDMNTKMLQSKQFFIDELNKIDGIRAFQSASNFVAVHIEDIDMVALKTYLQDNGIIIRLFDDHGETLARIAIGKKETMENVIALIKKYLRDTYDR